jgi:hypothetical protein
LKLIDINGGFTSGMMKRGRLANSKETSSMPFLSAIADLLK